MFWMCLYCVLITEGKLLGDIYTDEENIIEIISFDVGGQGFNLQEIYYGMLFGKSNAKSCFLVLFILLKKSKHLHSSWIQV